MHNDGQDFETLVELIERSIHVPIASIERNVKLPELANGKNRKRQVDVLITIASGHAPTTIAVEAKDHRRAVNIATMEQTVAKHAKLGTGQLVVYSASGFSEPAQEAADAAGAVTVEPTEMESDRFPEVIAHRLESVWFKAVHLTPIGCRVLLSHDGEETAMSAGSEVGMFDGDGRRFGSVNEVAHALGQAYLDATHVKIVRDIAESGEGELRLATGGPPEVFVSGIQVVVHVLLGVHRHDEDTGIQECLAKGLMPVDELEFTYRAKFEVARLRLRHQQFGDVAVSYGDADGLSFVVATHNGETKATARLPDGRTSTSQMLT